MCCRSDNSNLGLALEVKFAWAFCVMLGEKESLGIASKGPALLFEVAEMRFLNIRVPMQTIFCIQG